MRERRSKDMRGSDDDDAHGFPDCAFGEDQQPKSGNRGHGGGDPPDLPRHQIGRRGAGYLGRQAERRGQGEGDETTSAPQHTAPGIDRLAAQSHAGDQQ